MRAALNLRLSGIVLKTVTRPSRRFRPSVGILSTSNLQTGWKSRRAYHQETMATTQEDKIPQPETETETVEASSKVEEQLPPLSEHDFKIFNQLAVKMDYFHDHFRKSWNLLWNACTSNRRPSNMTLRQFLDEGLHFAEFLTMHHNIEETYFFPMLAKKMPEFRGGRAELIRQHRQIHAGLDGFEAYLKACKNREVDFEMDVLKGKMESWGDVLWTHLDEEVKTLGAENMRKYWTKDEMQRLRM